MQTFLSVEAAEPDVYMGLGSLAYALAKADGSLQPEELATVRRLFANEFYGDLALRAFLLQEYHDESVENAYGFATRRLTASRHVLDDDLKEHLLSVLRQVAEACPGDSGTERALLRKLKGDFRRL